MKNLPIILIVSGLWALAQTAGAEPGKYTANYVRGHSVTELGKTVGVDVSWVQLVRRSASGEFAVYAAHTWDEREKLPGGIIPVVMPASEEAKFVQLYETSPDIEKRRGPGGADLDTRRLTGALRQSGAKVFYIDLTKGAAAKANLDLGVEKDGSGGPSSRRERIREKLKGKS